eukprot:jgi/Chrpa1/4049/Chrysochromulina_OHIO_Genome00002258-RA
MRASRCRRSRGRAVQLVRVGVARRQPHARPYDASDGSGATLTITFTTARRVLARALLFDGDERKDAGESGGAKDGGGDEKEDDEEDGDGPLHYAPAAKLLNRSLVLRQKLALCATAGRPCPSAWACARSGSGMHCPLAPPSAAARVPAAVRTCTTR